jgi:hypothetical protein
MSNLQRGFGYIPQLETPELIDEHGIDNDRLLCHAKGVDPTYPVDGDHDWNPIKNQGSLGSCVGASLSSLASVLHAQNTGHLEDFSIACGYYQSQRIAGIRGDKGSTISAAQKLITGDGICLESDWKYTGRYSNRVPSGFDQFPKVKLLASKTVKDVDLIFEFLRAGACIHVGLGWNRSCELNKCTRYTRGSGGGHAVYLYGLDKENPKYAKMFNSWSRNFGLEGMVYWKDSFLSDVLKDSWSTFVAYSVGEFEADEGVFE